MKIRRIILVLFTVLGLAFTAVAQPYNNEWINFSKTYYKFKVGKDSLYQISKSALQQIGLDAIPVEQFKLFRNGVEEPIFTSVVSGVLPDGGYIEFWGKANDGLPDRALYRRPEYQHVTNYNLHSDTAVYFLTIDVNGNNKRFQSVNNDVNGNVLPSEPYFLHKAANYFKEQQNSGFAADLEEYVYSSSYDKGEFWSSWDIGERQTRLESLRNLKVSAVGPEPILRYGAFGKSVRTRKIRVGVNNNLLEERTLNYFDDVVTSINVPKASILSGSADIAFTDVQPPPTGTENYTDRMVLSFYELTYPREFDFNSASQFYFELEPRTAGYFLEIKNYNTAGFFPVLYDLETQERYVGNTALAGFVRFSLTGSARQRKMVLVNPQAGFVSQVNSFSSRTFTDYSNADKQGDYLIISNRALFNGTNGNNPVDSYRSYRASALGGGHTSKVYDIEELTDQFAFGIFGHPSSVRNFISYAKKNFPMAISSVFIIGKGVNYTEYKTVTDWSIPIYVDQDRLRELNLVPTFGYPGSDNMLSSASSSDPVSTISIGRLSVINGVEIENYLEKVKEFEGGQKNAPNTMAGRFWMKNIVHVTGASDALLGAQLCNYMTDFKRIIQDTLTGSRVDMLCKTVSNPTDQAGTIVLRNRFEEGINMLTYFGHSSASTLEFNIEDPNEYNNQGKYPFMSVMGCYAGDIFRYSLTRFSDLSTLSEKFTLYKQRGSIAFIASTHFGVTNYLSTYLSAFYKKMSKTDYGKSIGKLHNDALADMMVAYGQLDFLARTHAEQLNLHGDPALIVNPAPKPDYDIEESLVDIDPGFVSVADRSFHLKVKYVNLGKATSDSVHISIKRILPNGTSTFVYNQMRPAAYYADSLEFDLSVTSLTDIGANKISVVIDGIEKIDEIDELNNSTMKTFFVYEDGATPVFPYNYAIVTDPKQKLFASTANPFAKFVQYTLEIDTTALFNSPLKKVVNLSSVGGILEFDPQINYSDSTVYYWRTAMVPASGLAYLWSQSSFMYRLNSKEGFNQSHYYQHLNSVVKALGLKTDRVWKFDDKVNNVTIKQAMYPTSGTQEGDFAVVINDVEDIRSACVGNSLLFNVIDPLSFEPWKNVDENNNNLNRYGSGSANCKGSTMWNFEFSFLTPDSRKKIMDFMDSIPKESYVIIRSIDYNLPNSLAPTWLSDTALYGKNNSLYHKLVEVGLTEIDQLNEPKCWAILYKKGDAGFVPQSKISAGIYDRISFAVDCLSPQHLGTINSPQFGPAKAWKELHWKGHQVDKALADQVTVGLYGKNGTNDFTFIREFSLAEQDADITDIDAKQYPFLQLRMRNADSTFYTPYQLDFWKLYYDPAPEGALAPNLFFNTQDTVDLGAIVNFGIAFKNVSKAGFDSLKVKVILTDRNNVPHEIPQSLLKPLIIGDTVVFRYAIDTRVYPGANTLFVEFNPNDHQPEQYHFNNFLSRSLYVRYDKLNPVLDVTFDGMHILSGDIVSAKPWIQIKLKDESKFLLLKDTSLLRVKVKYPDGTIRSYRYDNDTVRFTPAVNASDNTATIDFTPAFLNTYREDGVDNYELTVTGRDASNNLAGKIDYNINFLVINKPMISNLLNYPNPFTTSTAFVFTITGSEIPGNFKIQILTVTGKIVREITGDELGPLHIGRNITEFKWDGTDQFGQRLANGVYLYRVITLLNGKKMDKFKSESKSTDKFFNNGYGKMYLMR